MRLTSDLIARYDRPGPRYTSYPTALEFHDLVTPAIYEGALRSADPSAPVSLYVHLPFCAARCLYCACHAIINPDGRAAEPYLTALLQEIELIAARNPRRKVLAVHFGGGTPTFFSAMQLEHLMQTLRARFDIAPHAELSIELDPRAIAPDHIDWMRAERFGRASIGVQDLDPQVQQAVCREQPLSMVRALVDDLREKVGISSLNVDLIYGLPHQTPEGFEATLRAVSEHLKPERLAIYGFAYVPWLKPHQRRLNPETFPDAAARVDLLMRAGDVLDEAAYARIGMDHFALPTDSLFIAQQQGRLSRNFMGYSATHTEDLIGLGLSAIGYVNGVFVQNQRHLRRYLECGEAGQLPTERGYSTSDDDLRRGWVIEALMCQFHVDKTKFERRFGLRFDSYFSELRGALSTLEADGLLTQTPQALTASPTGRLLIRNIALAFDWHTAQRQAAAAHEAQQPQPNPQQHPQQTPPKKPQTQAFSRTV
jgi:oxygen-independent coproporphyrinogen-3 oxidase